MTLGGILRPSQRAANIFHSTFHGDPGQARPYLRNSEKMADHVYQRKLGNGDERNGDGYAYRGGGFLQITGRDHYRDVGLEERPEQMDHLDVAARASVDHWLQKGLNGSTFDPIESRQAFDEVTKKINPPMLGGEARWNAYGRGLRVLSKPGAAGQ